MKLKHIISSEVKVAYLDQSVLSLLEKMQQSGISSIVVIDSDNSPQGIFTEYDVTKVVAMGMNLDGVLVKDFLQKQKLFVLDQDLEIAKAFEYMQGNECRHIVATGSDGAITGVATQSDFLKYLDTQMLIKFKTVEDVMVRSVVTASMDYSVNDAAMIMMENKISSIVVVDTKQKPIGIITERDMVRYANQSGKNILLEEAMSSPVITISPKKPLIKVLHLMKRTGIRRMVVVDKKGDLKGIITRHDILKTIESKKIEILSHTINQKNYELEVIHKQEEELKLLDIALKSSANAVVITDVDAKIKWCNKAFETLTGYSHNEVLGKKPKELIKSGVHGKEFYQKLWETILAKKNFKAEVVNRKKNGTLYDEKLTITPLVNAKNKITHFIAIKEDITKIKTLQKSIIESEKRFKNLFDQAPMPYQSLDKDGYIVEVNQAWLELSGYKYKEVIGTFIGNYIKIKKDDLGLLKSSFANFLKNGEMRGDIFQFVTKEMVIKTIEMNGRLSKDSQSKKIFMHCLLYDITEKKAMQERIHHIAHYDTLTGLANRVSLNDELNHAIARAQRNETKVALLLLGLDRFKDINDSFGHGVGDELLILVSQKIQKEIQNGEFVARVAGDEFAILVEDVKSDYDCALLAQRFITALNKTWHLSNGVTIYLNATTGIATCPDTAQNAKQLFQYADAALFLAKKENRGKYRFYNDEITAQARKNIDTLAKLKESILKEEFIVLYQPQIDLQSGEIKGAESLIRWKKENKLISPLEFISLAEERGLIGGITEFVFRQTCLDMQRFLKLKKDLQVSINLSTVELTPQIVPKLKMIAALYNIKSQNLGVEIMESIFINDIQSVVKILQQFKKEGFLISLDDFGVGYSSLHYLKRLPVDILKIDKSFVDGVPRENDDKQITKAIISMAKTLGLQVLAEGVETKEQLEFLKNEGCEYMQGYYFSKPISADEFIKLLSL